MLKLSYKILIKKGLQMRELIKKDQLVTIIPHDFNDTNKGKVTDVSMDGFSMQLKYVPRGLLKQNSSLRGHYCPR